MELENTTGKNVMIAQYMNVEYNPTYGYLLTPHIYTKAHQLNYHISFDLLIPVYKKVCVELNEYTSDIMEFHNALLSCDIKRLYNAIIYAIELIKQHQSL